MQTIRNILITLLLLIPGITSAFDVELIDGSPTGSSFYTGVSLPYGIDANTDGDTFYWGDFLGKKIKAYSTTTPNTVIGAVFINEMTVTCNAYDFTFGDNGENLYIVCSTGVIQQYQLATAWDLSTATFYGQASVSGAKGVAVSLDGLHLYFSTYGTNVYQYSMSEHNITTLALANSYSVTNYNYSDIEVSPLGEYIFIVALDTDTIYQYEMSTPYDVSTSQYLGSKYIYSYAQYPLSFAFSWEGGNLYINDNTGDMIRNGYTNQLFELPATDTGTGTFLDTGTWDTDGDGETGFFEFLHGIGKTVTGIFGSINNAVTGISDFFDKITNIGQDVELKDITSFLFPQAHANVAEQIMPTQATTGILANFWIMIKGGVIFIVLLAIILLIVKIKKG